MPIKPLSVSQINNYIKRILTTDPILGNVTVTGELSNLVHHSSGHCYFVLKDEKSRLSCFLPADRLQQIRYVISDGMQVVVSGSLSVYERGGTYSLSIRELDPAGEGALNLAFENLKARLDREGLFDPSRKKQLPPFPSRIAVVTSPTGAAVRDVITTIRRRNPLVDIRIYPCLVQGTEAAASIVWALTTANMHCRDLDLIILGRGGGSLEDLWPFNEESVARAIAASILPVISAVGHETDTVISDYAADLRAATPTAAAERAVPDIEVSLQYLRERSPDKLYRSLSEKLQRSHAALEQLRSSAASSVLSELEQAERKIELLALRYEMSNPLNILKRGYSILKTEQGRWVTSASELSAGDRLTLLLKDGRAHCTVEEVETQNEIPR